MGEAGAFTAGMMRDAWRHHTGGGINGQIKGMHRLADEQKQAKKKQAGACFFCFLCLIE
jgi:hypothetical protein